MRKSQLSNLVAGSKVMDKRNNTVLEVVGLEGGKYILSNGKCYSESTTYIIAIKIIVILLSSFHAF